MPDHVEFPRPLRLLRTISWSLTESAGLPIGALALGAWLYGRDAGLLAGLAATWVVALRQPARHHPGLHRFFQGATWLWAGIFLLLTAGLAILMVTEPLQAFMVASTVATVGLTAAGIAISAVWFWSVLRRSGLRVR